MYEKYISKNRQTKLLLKSGKDPSGVKRSQKLNRKIQNNNTFGVSCLKN
jgi:hypothetical protein